METHRHPDPAEAAAALHEVQRGRRAAARTVTTPWWYHPLVGLTIAVMLGAGSLPLLVRLPLVLVSVAALFGLFALYRRLTGLWVNALEIPGTRRATTVAVAVTVVAYGLAYGLEEGMGVEGALAVAGVLLGVGYTLFWRWVDRRLVELWQAAP